MPDWCANRLSVSGEPAAIAAFAGAVGDEDRPLDFERIRPTPAGLATAGPERADELAEISGLTEPTSRYTWRVRNWGTKWNLGSDTSLEDGPDPGCRVYLFGTAWSPPLALAEHAIQTHPGLRVELVWHSPATGEAGLLAGEDGQVSQTVEVSADASGWLTGLGLGDWIEPEG